MRLKLLTILVCLGVLVCLPLSAQTHTSVPLENNVYYILEQAETKGLCAPLSGTKPYPQSVVLAAVNEILNSERSGKLTGAERTILEQYAAKSAKPKTGVDWQRGAYYNETTMGKSGFPLSIRLGAAADIEGSAGIYPAFGERYWGTETWIRLILGGDLGRHVSWEFSGSGGLAKAPRMYLGTYNTYYAGFVDDPKGEYVNQLIDTYSEPLTHFPYTYRKRWDGSIYFFKDLSAFESWPDSIAGGYNLKSELTASFFDNALIARVGRLTREWGSVSFGSNIGLNQAARPFLGAEAEFSPFSWFGISSMTGILEYYNSAGIKDSALHNQNAFSTTMLQFRYKNYVYLDIGEAVVWPKRFELGYVSPITNSIFYQNNIGDFDNMSMIINLKAQYPGIGNLWFSLFWDEAFWVSNWYELDRTMLAGQAGLTAPLPFLAFSSIKLSYTKVNPYCYTHNRNYNPWYGNIPMETSYTNNGVGLGYYLPPNSDEVLVRFKTMPVYNLITHLQYQMIRHGADFGPSAVDGSSLLSELDPNDRGTRAVSKRYFLHDGAYQWMHVIKIGAEWTLPTVPLAIYGEAGAVISYFTDIETGKANSGASYPHEIIDTPDYPKSTGFVVTIGFRLFP
ncbi:MAG: hypothetical protein LBD48_11245 [Treponema sp.]|nr:hypothetical protein [Treponema sp.]